MTTKRMINLGNMEISPTNVMMQVIPPEIKTNNNGMYLLLIIYIIVSSFPTALIWNSPVSG